MATLGHGGAKEAGGDHRGGALPDAPDNWGGGVMAVSGSSRKQWDRTYALLAHRFVGVRGARRRG